VQSPVFLPDTTKAVVGGLDSAKLGSSGVEGVSCPTCSIGGRSKGMHANYSRMAQEALVQCGWSFTNVEYEQKLLFVVDPRPSAA